MAGVTISPSPTYMTEAAINCSTGSDNTIVSASTGLVVRVYRMFFVVGGATTVTIKDGSSNSLTGPIPFGAAGGALTLDTSGDPWFQTSKGNAFIINENASVQISGAIWYTQTTPLGG